MNEDGLSMQEMPDANQAPKRPENGRKMPKNIRFRKLRLWSRYFRIRIARAVLLPELSASEAQTLRQGVHNDGALTSGYILMCALSAGIATLGLLQSSTAVVIGAMLISPLMSPIAALGFGFASIDGHRIREAARVVIVGAVVGILTGMIITWLSPIRNATPEILARTQPTLLDLAIALFSGIAGGYATVIQRGGTAIGVAIATALMPPLAVLGYGIGVLQPRFALGALLLFLTNLAAITLAFAFVARLSGVARPLYKVEWNPRYIFVFIIAFLALGTPLSMTLVRLSYEAQMRSAASSAIIEACGGDEAHIAQLDVSWPLFGEPSVDALVIAPSYTSNARQKAEELVAREMDKDVTIHLQQVLAADWQSQTRAMVDAAMERTAAGIAADVPPFEKIRASIGLPTSGIWTNRAERTVYVAPVAAPGWGLADYRDAERLATKADQAWTVRLIPPAQSEVRIELPRTSSEDTASDQGETEAETDVRTLPAELAIWALHRWGMTRVVMAAPEGDAAKRLRKTLNDAGITVATAGEETPVEEGTALLRVYAPRPAEIAAAKAAVAKATAAIEGIATKSAGERSAPASTER